MTLPGPGALAVIVTDWGQSAWAKRFAALAPGRAIAEWPDISNPAQIAYAAVWRPEPGALAAFPNLKAIFNLGAGVDHLLDDPALPDVPVVRVVDDSLTAPMSTYIVAQVLLHFRQHLAYMEFQRQQRWKPLRQPHAGEMGVGILGLGTLGRDAAAKLLGLGFNVAGWSRSPKSIEGVRSFAGPGQLDDFLARTDILVSLLPATPATRGMVDRSLLARLRQGGPLGGAIYINAGRGATQVEADILAALEAGELAGASIDVFETEPLDRASPLWRHPRVVVTPHVAADTDLEAISRYVIEQIHKFEAGRPLANIVERSKGY
ncbi:D-3-phosphoglycerate dehydrogenase [hydrothermal vent metagenome]|uniref:D-3-phosphoglycerate dehydrogenase n=1 Tax=hydrothermal vent metagenome TaxID=652676 RepID=A0A3B0TEU7_9ZZZZ